MDLIIKSEVSPPVWTHFLLGALDVRIRHTNTANRIVESPATKSPNDFRWTVPDDTVAFDIVIQASFRNDGRDYPLLRIVQTFGTERTNDIVTRLTPLRWQKLAPDQAVGLTKGIPPVHPLLRFDPANVAVSLSIAFVDITKLFFDIHGDTPWYSALELLKGTARSIRVLASLRGHPLIWYVVIPDSVAAESELQPVVLYYPADYGGINYANSMAGIASANHNTSVGNVQCGGETLVSFLTKPLSDDAYDAKLNAFVNMRNRFKKRPGRNPPPLHHYRDVLNYHASGATLTPDYWDVPFGFETALSEQKKILLVPQMNGGEGGIGTRAGLKGLVESALLMIYAQGNVLNRESVSVGRLILTSYSQSGGNVFTTASQNSTDVKALVCFEPQYMNQHLKDEDKTLVLGKNVIPTLLRQGVKVAIIGRHKDGWERKYLPDGVPTSGLILLPDDANYFLLGYPDSTKPYNTSASPVLIRRYSRLLRNRADAVVTGLVGGKAGDKDVDSALAEEKVETIIERQRTNGVNDERLIKLVFVPPFNVDDSGGYFTHNFILAGGQDIAADTVSINQFFTKVLSAIG